MGRLRQSSPAEATGRHALLLAALRRAVFESPGRTDPATRKSAASGGFLHVFEGCGIKPSARLEIEATPSASFAGPLPVELPMWVCAATPTP
jgi:hypothetical protein